MKVRLGNVQGMKRFLKENGGGIPDITDKSSIGKSVVTVSPDDFAEVDSFKSGQGDQTRMTLLTDGHIIIVHRKDGKVTSCEAVQRNPNNMQLVYKYMSQGSLDSYDEFEKNEE